MSRGVVRGLGRTHYFVVWHTILSRYWGAPSIMGIAYSGTAVLVARTSTLVLLCTSTWYSLSLSAGYAVVVVLTLTRIIKSVVTGQAPVTLERRNTPR